MREIRALVRRGEIFWSNIVESEKTLVAAAWTSADYLAGIAESWAGAGHLLVWRAFAFIALCVPQ